MTAAGGRNIWSRVRGRAGRQVGPAGADGPPHGWQLGWPAGVAMAVSAALLISLVIPVSAAVRFALAVAFVMFGPGTAVLIALGSRSLARPELGLIIAVGMATTVLVAEALVWLGFFHPRPELAVAAAAVLIMVGAGAWTSRMHGPAASAGATGQRPRPPGGTSTAASDDAGEG